MNPSAPQSTRSAPALTCPSCQGPVDVRSPHVAVAGTAVVIYCSEACLQGLIELDELDELVPIEAPRPRRARWWIVAGIVIGGSFVVVQTVGREPPIPSVPLVTLSEPMPTPKPPPITVAVDAPPAQDEALLHELMQDAWIHPLAGPHRRMPINHTAAFGAERQGQPPPECLSGHCGVDVGMSWGEPIHAVHDGVVDWVNRGPNEEHGGIFVKIAHRGGQLYSWYFHLAGVPRWVQPGTRVTVGQVIGLLGDTGILHSVPHLHFALTVKAAGGRERYVDPESLLAIWPLWIVEDGKGHVSTAEPPGIPVRAPARVKPVVPAPAPLDSDRAAPPDHPALPGEPAAPAAIRPIDSPAPAAPPPLPRDAAN